MKPLSASEIRRRFIQYFEERGHTHVPSSSLVPQNDPTLMFVNAGMNQFKDVFTGRETRPYTRAVSVQRCVRAGGKHNDLDNVGYTPRHQTLFEMLGNFSFGDYFKSEAIAWGWGFLTEALGIPAERLVVTVFNGEGEDAPPDQEAFELWKQFVPEDRIYWCSAKDNFWQMGNTGPCGPCSEIHLFKGDVAPGEAHLPERGPAYEDDRYLELWNLVFMQYEKFEDGHMEPLPKPSIDTGAGLERLAATVAGVPSNYETDLLAPMVECARELAGPNAPKDLGDVPYRVIADHARAAAFLIADGVFPDKQEREYVLRRIMRRAIRYGTDVGLDEPFLHTVCAKVIEVFGEINPLLVERAATIREVVLTEEEAFRRTLGRGLRLLEREFEQLGDNPTFNPAVAANLYTTYGFPIDLTGIIVKERGKTLDEDAARTWVTNADVGTEDGVGVGKKVEDIYFALRERLGDTSFLGYATHEGQGEIRAMLIDGQSVDLAGPGSEVEIVLDQTPMYGESGGQVGDTGEMRGTDQLSVAISDTIKPVGQLFVHRGRVQAGTLRVGARVQVEVDQARRSAIRRNHSATHLLHLALRSELGDHVVQKGSLVTPDRLRFDYSHNKALSQTELQAIESRVNAMVLDNAETTIREMSIDDAKAEGAMGLFEAKYGEVVRVVRIANDSLELCGGIHVHRAGDIGSFAILSDSAIAQGVRRIEAVTGMGAIAYLQELASVARDAMGLLHVGDTSAIAARIEKLQGDLKARDREIGALQTKLATGAAGENDRIDDVAGVKLLAKKVAVADAKALRSAADALRDRLGSGVVVLGAQTGDKAMLLVAVTQDLKGRVHAGKLVGTLAQHLDGKGGGRPDMAQAGGPNLAGLEPAIAAANATLAEMLGAS